MAANITYKIEKEFGVLSEGKGGWKTELNLVSWGDRPAKFDIRSWAPDHESMSKGVTLTKDEILRLKELLSSLDFESLS